VQEENPDLDSCVHGLDFVDQSVLTCNKKEGKEISED